jgi:hypothetical protein
MLSVFQKFSGKVGVFLRLSAFLAAVFLFAACSNPDLDLEDEESPEDVPPEAEPFTVDVQIGALGEYQFMGNYNFMQLAVADDTGEIFSISEYRKESDGDLNALLEVPRPPVDLTYHILLLMGHWERDYAADYTYLDAPPTLLAAGYTSADIAEDTKTVTITMYPLAVKPVFNTPTEQGVEVTDWLYTSLVQGHVDITWTISQGALSQLDNANLGDGGTFAVSKSVIRGQDVYGDLDNDQLDSARNNNVFTLSVPDVYTVDTARRGKNNSANLRVEYQAFGKDLINREEPVRAPKWIIRNGVNDKAQDKNTTFGQIWNGTKNGNGAVVFTTGYVLPAANPASADALNNADVDEFNLLIVLRQPDVPAAMEELHRRIQTKQRGGLKLGMYLDLPSLKPTGEETIMFDSSTMRTELASLTPWAMSPEEESASLVDVTRENLRILIASFDQYKDAGNTDDHIKLTFKHIPVLKRMRSVDTSEGGYPGGGDTAEARLYLEGPFYEGLKAALGINENVFYPVTRGLAGGTFENNYNVKIDYTKPVFIDTEYEVRGRSSYAIEEVLKQTALYKKKPEYKLKFSYCVISSGWGFESTYWLASPYPRLFKLDNGNEEEQPIGENNKFLIISEDAQTRALQEGATGAYGTVNDPTHDPACSYGKGVDYIQNRRVPTDQRAVDYYHPSRPTAGVSPSFCIR